MEEKKLNIEVIENSSFKPELIIPKNVEEKIRYLCNQVHDREWSGTLFYTAEGSFEEKTFKATCLDICVMDIGNTVTTVVTDSPDIVTYRIDHPELLNGTVYEGIVHSHHNMGAFFSQTDVVALKEDGNDRNHALSLVVDNRGKYVARITRKINKETQVHQAVETNTTSYYDTFNSKRVSLEDNIHSTKTNDFVEKEIIIEYFNMEINKATVEDRFEELATRLRNLSTKTTTKKVFDKTNYEGNLYRWYADYKDDDRTYEVPKKEFKPVKLKNTDNVIRNLAIQLVTGSVLVGTNNFDMVKWLSKIDTYYATRFKNPKDYEVWMDTIMSYLFIDNAEAQIDDKELKDIDETRYLCEHVYDYIWDIYTKHNIQSKIVDDILDRLLDFCTL